MVDAQGKERPDATYITQYFEDCLGVQYKETPLVSSPRSFRSLKNMGFGKGYSIEGRRGKTMVGAPGGFAEIFTYSYLDSATGATKSELLALNENLWKLTEYDFSVTRTGGASDWSMGITHDANGQPFYTIVQGGVTVYNRNLGNGLGLPGGPDAMYNIRAEIHSLANFDITAYPFGQTAIKDGVQTGGLGGHVLTVVNTTNFFTQDHHIYFSSSSVGQPLTAWLQYQAPTATQLYVNSSSALWAFDNGQVLGTGSSPAVGALLPEANEPVTNTNTVKSGKFYEWQIVPSTVHSLSPPQHTNPSYYASHIEPSTSTSLPASVVNTQQGCYILAPAGLPPSASVTSPPYQESYEGFPWKYDGRFFQRAGLPQVTINSVTQPYSAPYGSNTRRFIAVPKLRDYRGVVIRGPASPPFEILLGGSPVSSAPYNVVTTTIRDITGFYTTGAIVNGAAQAVPGTFNVVAGHNLLPGDVVTASILGFSSNVTITLTVTAATVTTLTVTSEAGVLVPSRLVTPLSIEIYATEENGVDFYFAGESPNSPFSLTAGVGVGSSGNIPLGARYDAPELTFEPFPPPRANTMCLHNGAIVLGGNPDFPNSVFWSRPGANPSSNVESFPPLNTAVIQSAVEGPISAIISDGSDRLVIGKPAGHYELTGNIHNRNIGLTVKREGDWGFSSQSSVQKVNGVIFGLCPLGLYAIRGGEYTDQFSAQINPILRNLAGADYSTSRGFNDRINGLYHLYLPAAFSGDALSGQAEPGGSIHLVMDYTNQNTWFNWDYPQGQGPTSGFAVLGEGFFTASLGRTPETVPIGTVFRQLYMTGDRYRWNYRDHLTPIPYEVSTNFLHDGAPSFDKLFLQLKLWHFTNLNVPNTFVPATYTLTTFRDFQTVVPDTTTTITVANETDFESVVNFFEESKARSLLINLTVQAIGERPLLSGLELLMKATYSYRNFYK